MINEKKRIKQVTDIIEKNISIIPDNILNLNPPIQLYDNDFLNHVLNSLDDVVIWSYSPGDKYPVYVSPSVENILGYTVDDFYLARETWMDIIHPDDITSLINHFLSFDSLSLDFRIIRADGEVRWVRNKSKIYYDEKGNTSRIDGVITDITNDKKLETTLEDSNQMYKSIMENSHDLMTLHTLDELKYVYANPATLNKLGYTLEELKGQSAIDFIHPEDRNNIKSLIEKYKPIGKAQTTLRYKKKDGSYFWIESTGALVDSKSQPVIVITSRDITEKKQMNEALKISEARYRAIVEDQTELICRFGRDTILTFVNEAYCKFFQKNEEQLIGYSFLSLVPEKDHQTVLNALYSLTPQNPLLTYEHQVISSDSTVCWQQWSDRAIFDENGEFFEYQSVGRDITERILAEQALKRAYDDMENRVQERTLELATTNTKLVMEIEERKQIEEQLRYMALHDTLTGLYNRTYFEEEIYNMEIEEKHSIGIIMCDVDGLKFINDNNGHQNGDRLLLDAAQVIKYAVDGYGTAARIGGDEFAVIIDRCNEKLLERIYQRIQDQVSSYNKKNPLLQLSISVGFAYKADSSVRLYDLLKTAENNMHRAKLYQQQSSRSSVLDTLKKALGERDFITQGHADRLQEILLRFSSYMGLPVQSKTEIRLLAQFHDIGKIGIPDNILFKCDSLTEIEREEMQRHTQIGYRIATSSPDLTPIADWILKHHEWWNGKGYPLGIAGEEIPLPCRMLTIADAYDAMTNDRPYRKALSHKEAVQELSRCSGTQFDPQLVPSFIKLLED